MERNEDQRAAMNIHEPFGEGREAILEYRDAEFAVLKPGAYVRCAVTGARIPLAALKYWNVDKQEAYADAATAVKGFGLRG
ncbi:MAG: DUF2093 domain-containing protein [Parvularculaceae bacterium]